MKALTGTDMDDFIVPDGSDDRLKVVHSRNRWIGRRGGNVSGASRVTEQVVP